MHTFVCELTDGDTIDQTLLVRDKQLRTNRNGNLYLLLDLMDRTGSISARYWNATEGDGRAFDTGDFVHLRGKVQMFQGQLQVIVNGFEKRDPTNINVAEFIPTSNKDVDGLLSELRQQLAKVRNLHLRAIVQAFLMDENLMQRLMRAPAGVRHHHAYIGGLLEHIVNLLKTFDRISDLFPELDPDLMRVGIFLHDIGKVRELQYDRDFSYSDEGQLLGHLVVGVEMLSGKIAVARDLLGEAVPTDLELQLKHLIVSHHGTLEFGSPRLPMTVEAIALHHLDNLDAKVHNFSQMIRDDPNLESRWTAYDPKMDRRLFKGAPQATPRRQVVASNGRKTDPAVPTAAEPAK